MTLIIGIKCQNGIVVGADGAATLGALGQRTVRQSTTKLELIANSAILGVSGPVGLSQRFTDEIQSLWNARALVGQGADARPLTGPAAMVKISEALRKHIFAELQAASQAVQVVGPGICQTSAISQSLLAIPIGRTPHLFQFDQQGAPEEASDRSPLVAIGSGQSLADPFLAFVKRVIWKNALPNLNEGIFAALWTLHHAIETNPGGISEPMQIALLEDATSGWRPRVLSDKEQEEHFRGIEGVEEHLEKYFRREPEQALPAEPKMEIQNAPGERMGRIAEKLASPRESGT